MTFCFPAHHCIRVWVSMACAVACLFSAVSLQVASAQDSEAVRQLAAEPILIYRSNRLNEKTMFGYIEELGQELQIGKNLGQLMKQENVQAAITKHPNPVNGNMVFMAQGFIPAVESINFSEVLNEDEFERLIRAPVQGGVNGGELTGEKGKYKRVFSTSWREDITDSVNQAPPVTPDATDDADPSTEATEEDKPKNTLSIGVGVGSGASVQISSNEISNDVPIIEENGRKYREHSLNIVTYLRYHDGFMFTSTYSGLLDMSLPSAESLRGQSDRGLDAEVSFYPDRIPVGFKHLFWNTLSATANSTLQQRDEEDPVDHVFRKTSSEVGLTAMQTVLFDTDMVSGQLLFATSDSPVRGELTLRARKESNFAKSLGELSSAHSRFAPLLNDDAAITLHSCVKLPKPLKEVLTASGEWIRIRMTDFADVDLAIAGSEFEKTLTGIRDNGNFELLVQLNNTKESGTVVYGGLQVDDNPQLLKTVHDWLTRQVIPESMTDRLAIVERDGMPMIAFRLPDAPAESPVKLSHAYITHANSCLWFCLGGEDAYRIFKPTLEKLTGASVRTGAPLLTFKTNFGRWMSMPQDDPTGISQLIFLGDKTFQDASNQAQAAASNVSRDANGRIVARAGSTSEPKEESETEGSARPDDGLMQKVLDMGGTRDFSLVFDTDTSGFTLRTEVGAAVIRYFAARYIKMIDGFTPMMMAPQENQPAPSE